MRSYQVFAVMTPTQSEAFLATLTERVPAVAAQALAAASAAQKARPIFLVRQSPEKRAEAVRRCLSRVGASALAEELLAVYFLECRKDLLVEWLDAAGVRHEEGALAEESPPEPAPAALAAAVEKFRRGADPHDRELLLRAFAAQSAIEWPGLEALLTPAAAPA